MRIEELLEREPIVLDKDKIQELLQNKTILITGAAGSIGSEIVRQVIPYKPKKLILVDQAESPLYEIEMELKEHPYKPNYKAYIGDICNPGRIEAIFRTHKPEIVFHAAAYKHVPLMEENPTEAVLVNVKGTRYIADFPCNMGWRSL